MWVRTLVQGGQRADSVAGDLAAWLGEATKSLDLALYDLRLPGPVGDQVGDALRAARDRGVQMRIAFNDDKPEPEPRPFEPPPPRTEPTLLEQLGVPLRPPPGRGGPPPPSRDGGTSCTTSTWCATAPRCGPARRTGRWTPGRRRRTC